MITTAGVQGRLKESGVLETCYTPIIQSGEKCALKFSAQSNDKNIIQYAISGCLGMRYMVSVSVATDFRRTIVPTSPAP